MKENALAIARAELQELEDKFNILLVHHTELGRVAEDLAHKTMEMQRRISSLEAMLRAEKERGK